MNTLNGLVVCGGKSTRMGRDKFLLDYHGRPQYLHVHGLLRLFCSEVFISCSEAQEPLITAGIRRITDEPACAANGPAAGVLSAFGHGGDKDWLVIGCDYPLLVGADVQRLVDCFRANRRPVAYYEGRTGYFEPLLAVYPASCAAALQASAAAGDYSLQQFLIRQDAVKCPASDERRLCSADTPEDYDRVMQYLRTC